MWFTVETELNLNFRSTTLNGLVIIYAKELIGSGLLLSPKLPFARNYRMWIFRGEKKKTEVKRDKKKTSWDVEQYQTIQRRNETNWKRRKSREEVSKLELTIGNFWKLLFLENSTKIISKLHRAHQKLWIAY